LKPILVLDIDGPIAVLGTGPHLQEHAVAGWPVQMDPNIGQRLRLLSRHFAVVWFSSWPSSACCDLTKLLNLDPEPGYFNIAPRGAPGQSRKLFSLLKLAGTVPIAVVDDEIGYDMQAWSRERSAPSCLIEVDPRLGLQDHQVDTLLAFAQGPVSDHQVK
jgi:hypothetical protein